MKNFLSFVLFFIAFVIAFPQTVTLTFTGRDANNRWVRLDSVLITNMIHGWQEILYWPDTVLTMQVTTGIDDNIAGAMGPSPLQLAPNTPNPFNGGTDVTLSIADVGAVSLEILDMNGRAVVTTTTPVPVPGTHQFRINVADAGTYLLTARQNGKTSSIKMVNNGDGNGNGIEYLGMRTMGNDVNGNAIFPDCGRVVAGKISTAKKIKNTTNAISRSQYLRQKSEIRSNTTNAFDLGNTMEYVGAATINGSVEESQRITQQQNLSQTITLQFDAVQEPEGVDGQPCPGIPTITDIDNNIYATIQIGYQYWMKSNLKTTRYSDGILIPQGGDCTPYDNEPYWYYPSRNPDYKPLYGLLYSWAAVMGNAGASDLNPSGVQGICPIGWHVPSDAEWTQLTNYVRSQSQYVCGDTSIAKALADSIGWSANWNENECAVGNSDINNATGFSARPAGFIDWSSHQSFGVSAIFGVLLKARVVHLPTIGPWDIVRMMWKG